MEKKDVKIKVRTGELDNLDPQTKQLILELKRHFSGIIYSIARWAKANQISEKST